MDLGKVRIDGREATRRAKGYFVEVHGEYGVIGFKILEVKHDEQQGEWLVRCTFYPAGAFAELQYEVRVSDSGDILGVSKIEPPGPLPGELPHP